MMKFFVVDIGSTPPSSPDPLLSSSTSFSSPSLLVNPSSPLYLLLHHLCSTSVSELIPAAIIKKIQRNLPFSPSILPHYPLFEIYAFALRIPSIKIIATFREINNATSSNGFCIIDHPVVEGSDGKLEISVDPKEDLASTHGNSRQGVIDSHSPNFSMPAEDPSIPSRVFLAPPRLQREPSLQSKSELDEEDVGVPPASKKKEVFDSPAQRSVPASL